MGQFNHHTYKRIHKHSWILASLLKCVTRKEGGVIHEKLVNRRHNIGQERRNCIQKNVEEGDLKKQHLTR